MFGNSTITSLLCFAFVGLPLAGCSPEDVGADGPDAGMLDDVPDEMPSDPDPSPTDRDGDDVADANDNCPEFANSNQADGDADDVGDACDCEPADASIAAFLVVDDPLSVEHNLVAPVPGSPIGSWAIDADGYHQLRLGNNARDVAHLPALSLLDLRMSATIGLVDIQSFDTADLRQLLLTSRHVEGDDPYGALACGVELIESLGVRQHQTSILTLDGTLPVMDTELLDRLDRDLLGEGEEVQVTMDVRGDTLRCEVTLRGETTVATSTVPVRAGRVGFHTREARAVFKDLKVCEYRTEPAPVTMVSEAVVDAASCMFMREAPGTDAPIQACSSAEPWCTSGMVCIPDGEAVRVTDAAAPGAGCESWQPINFRGFSGWGCGELIVE